MAKNLSFVSFPFHPVARVIDSDWLVSCARFCVVCNALVFSVLRLCRWGKNSHPSCPKLLRDSQLDSTLLFK